MMLLILYRKTVLDKNILLLTKLSKDGITMNDLTSSINISDIKLFHSVTFNESKAIGSSL